jgi:DNA-binding MarR family transcriptional regulator
MPVESEVDDGGSRDLLELLKLASLINRPMLEDVAAPAGLSLNELRVLLGLAERGGMAAHELAELKGLHPMAVSRAVSALRDAGHVAEGRDPANRRRKMLALTSSGRDCVATLTPGVARVARRLLASLSPAEQRTAARLVAKLVAQLEAWPKGDHGV